MTARRDKLGANPIHIGAESLDIPNISLREHWREHFAGMAIECAYALAVLFVGGLISWLVVALAATGVFS